MSKKKSPDDNTFKRNRYYQQIPSIERDVDNNKIKRPEKNQKKVSITSSLPNLSQKNKYAPSSSIKLVNQQISTNKQGQQKQTIQNKKRSISNDKKSSAVKIRKSSKSKGNEDFDVKKKQSSNSQRQRKKSKSFDKNSRSRSRSISGGASVQRKLSQISQDMNQQNIIKIQHKVNRKDGEKLSQKELRDKIAQKEKQLQKISQKAQKIRDSMSQNENQSINIRIKSRNAKQEKKLTRNLQDQLIEKEQKIISKINQIRVNSKDPEIGGGLRSQNFTRIVEDLQYPNSSLDNQSPLRTLNPRQTYFNQGNDKLESILKNKQSKFDKSVTIYDEIPEREQKRYNQPLRNNYHQAVINNITENQFSFENKARERVQILENDIYQMKRRLQLVSEEVIRTQEEQEILLRRLSDSKYEIERLERAKVADMTSDQHTQHIQSEIEYQNIQNNKIKEDINLNQQNTQQIDLQILKILNNKKEIKTQFSIQSHEVNLRLKDIASLESKIFNLKQKIEDYYAEIQHLQQDEKKLGLEKLDLENKTKKIQKERIDIHEKLEQKQIQLDEEIKYLTDNNELIESDFEIQTKFISAKLIFNLLKMYQENRKGEAFLLTHSYSKFDKNCQERLKMLCMITHKIQVYKQRMALSTWYDNSFRPIQQIQQNQLISKNIHNTKLKMISFNTLKRHLQNRISKYLSKTYGVNIIWENLHKNRRSEIKRALQIWKEYNSIKKSKIKSLKQIIQKTINYNRMKSIEIWRKNLEEINKKCRILLLQKEYSQKIFLQSIFQAIKNEAKNQRKLKYLRLIKIFDEWKKQIIKKKHIIELDKSSQLYIKQNREYIVQVCFDALKINQKKRAKKLTANALQNDMNLSIQQNSLQTQQLKQSMQQKQLSRACQTILKACAGKLFSYFNQWSKFKVYKQSLINTKFKDKIIHIFRQDLEFGFQKWKKISNQLRIKRRKKIIEDIQQEFQQNETQSIEVQQNKAVISNEVRAVANHKGTKILRKFSDRLVKIKLYKWKSIVNKQNLQTGQQFLIFEKQRKRLLQQSWSRYKLFLQKCRQHDLNVVTGQNLKLRLDNKKLRNMYNSFQVFVHIQQKAKSKLRIILQKVDLWIKKSTIKNWIQNGNLKNMNKLTNNQASIIDEIENKSRIIGQHDQNLQMSIKKISEIENSILKKAYTVIGNYLVRNNISNIQSRFKHWKQQTKNQNHRHQLIKKTINQWKKYKIVHIRNQFKNFINNQKVNELKHRQKQAIINQQESISFTKFNQEQLNTLQKNLNKQIENEQNLQQFKKKRLNKTIDIITNKNQQNNFISRKRMIFLSWQNAVKQQKSFILCVQNVLQKSMMMKGYIYILNFHRDEKRKQSIYKLCSKYFNTFKKINLSDFINTWKTNIQIKVVKQYALVQSQNMLVSNQFKDKIIDIKDQNCENVKNYFIKKFKKKIWISILQVIFKQEQKQISKIEAEQKLIAVKYKKSLQKWYQRVQTTFRIRQNFKCMKKNKIFRLKLMVWRSLQQRRDIVYYLVSGLSILEKTMRDVNKFNGFKSIKSMFISKELAEYNNRKRSLQDLMSILYQFHLKRNIKYFNRYKSIVKTKVNKAKHVKSILLKIQIANIRDGFHRWRKFMEKVVFAEEMNQTGPITEHVFEAQRTISNLVQFMRDEHFIEEEILNAKTRTNEYNLQLINKAILRIKIKRQDRCAIKCFEHWKMWIKIKKLFKFHLELANNKVQFGKCDLNWAFQNWRRSEIKITGSLQKKDWNRLKSLNIEQSKNLERKAYNQAENSSILNHLNFQRDELVDNLLKSQKLALSILHENQKHTLGKALNRWKDFKHDEIVEQLQDCIVRGLDQVAIKKSKILDIEQDNNKIEKENEELRNFTMSNYIVAKSAVTLSDECEKLRERMVDSNQKLKELIENNKILKKSLGILDYDQNENVGTKKGVTIKNVINIKQVN